MTLSQYPSWSDLEDHASDAQSFSMPDLFANDPNRASDFSVQAAGIFLDFSKNLIDKKSLDLFSKINIESKMESAVKNLFNGEKINTTENRAALHTLLRCDHDQAPKHLEKEAKLIADALEKMRILSEDIRNGNWLGSTGKKIKHVIHLGIGGSNLGPYMIDEALAPYRAEMSLEISCHYIANIDGHHISQILAQLDPLETLILIASKSFSTLETKINADTARKWLLTYIDEVDLEKHLVAITSNEKAAIDFGVSKNNILPMWDWVGGRYSLWSTVGLPIAIRYGYPVFKQLLGGAAEMDQHFASSPMKENIPMILAWLGIWYQHFFNAHSHAVIPYDHGLRFLPAHLQQLDMESNGKRIRLDGEEVTYPTGSIIWGGEGSNGQHAFHQLLHQGTRFVGLDFILPLRPHHSHLNHHDYLVANCLSQSQALLVGREIEDEESPNAKHRSMPGNRPSNTILVDQLTPSTLGALIALYEHKVFCQAVVWQINPFDQWGVELGKELGDIIYQEITDPDASVSRLDASTSALIEQYLEKRK
ncbi:MAG: glucose-6-phosphate isomerase [Candidatus Azotimanducaceae bacterium]|jgi:glucose-6-phosphate isomerase